MKKILIFVFTLFFISSCFNETVNNKSDVLPENNIKNQTSSEEAQSNIKSLYSCSDLIEGNIDNDGRVNNKVFNSFISYKILKENYSDKELLDKISNDFNTTEGFALKKCEIIKEDYGKKLCNIYVSGDYSELDNFDFEDGETKEEIILLFDSLEKGVVLENAKEKVVTSILNFKEYSNNISFDFSDIEGSFNVENYSYLKANGEKKFFDELDSQFLLECNRLINEN